MLNKIELYKIEEIARKAAESVLEIYENDFTIEYKKDNSPLTQADIKANDIICDSLKTFYPFIPLLSEENKEIAYEERKDWEYYWCIDPIDGTKEFIKHNGEFTINIALIHKNKPVLGVVYAPVLNDLYSAKQGYGAFKNGKRIPLEREEDNSYIVVVSKSHLSQKNKEFIESIETAKKKKVISKGSSLKLCMVAESVADIYPRLSPTMEWDTAAADAIVRESGKMCYHFDTKEPLVYNKENLLNPWFVVE